MERQKSPEARENVNCPTQCNGDAPQTDQCKSDDSTAMNRKIENNIVVQPFHSASEEEAQCWRGNEKMRQWHEDTLRLQAWKKTHSQLVQSKMQVQQKINK